MMENRKGRLDMLCMVCGQRVRMSENAFIRGDGRCPVCKAKYNTLTCTRCGNVWDRRGIGLPDICPKCKSPYWNRERLRDKV